ncbi:transcriptional regulator, TetR family [Gloeothece citriformis PCC 7424]|uniref:Transcriptional regulator, TetR family n=1 Tax=Gloeothece citriformis (strain PCC 7424) TaxID=65393 RepID=B7KD56_GLOC7|nr:TetR/AcrR family transcriptional regulator [Gloeothece citriformis]ACK73177.1 transcriptional regulator, TetR family [Gloeothece citriformis PCC 7424]
MRRKPLQNRSKERVEQILNTAEQILIKGGYKETTTRAIASECGISVGSLYQFFPDKEAIILGLAERYNQQITELFQKLHQQKTSSLPLNEYVELVIDTFKQFFTDNPGYVAMFNQIQELIPQLLKQDADLNAQLVEELANFLQQRKPELEAINVKVIAFVVVEIVGTLLWVSYEQEPSFREQLISQTKFLVLTYLQSHFQPQP